MCISMLLVLLVHCLQKDQDIHSPWCSWLCLADHHCHLFADPRHALIYSYYLYAHHVQVGVVCAVCVLMAVPSCNLETPFGNPRLGSIILGICREGLQVAPWEGNHQESIYLHCSNALIMFPGISLPRKINSGWPLPIQHTRGPDGGSGDKTVPDVMGAQYHNHMYTHLPAQT